MINKTSLGFILGFIAIIGLSLLVIVGAGVYGSAEESAHANPEVSSRN